MEVAVAVLKPKQGHASQSYKPQLYDILLLDSKTPQGEKVKPAKYMPMLPMKAVEDEPRELVLTHVHKLTGIKGGRALHIQWNKAVPGSHRESLNQFSLFFVPVSPNDKISKKCAEQAQNTPGFYPLEYMIDAVDKKSVHFPSPTKAFLLHLESWLKEKHQRASAIECLFRPRAEFRIPLTVHNPVFIPSRITPEPEGGSSGKTAHFPQEIVKTANETLTKMLSIEKCDIVVMNPLFGSGLPYKTKPNTYVINHNWPSVPNYGKITSPPHIGPSGPRWRDRYPLHSYAAEGDKSEVDILLKKGYNHSQLDSVYCAPIHYAARYGCISVVELLLSAGCSPNLLDGEKSTPLHIAAKKGNVPLTKSLLQCPDIDLNIRDKDGKRAIDICLSVSDKTERHSQVDRLIHQASKRPNSPLEVFLMDKSSKNLQLVSGSKTTVQQLNEQMMKEFNLPKNYSDIFTLWIGSKSLELQLKLEREVVKEQLQWYTRCVKMLTDSRYPPEEEKPILTWRRNVKVSVEKEKQLQHPKALDLLFHEAYHNYINGLYPCEGKDTINFATLLFSLQHHSAVSVKSMLSNLNQSQGRLKELIPAAVLKQKDSTYWVNKISKEYTSLSKENANVKENLPQHLKSLFLTACQRLTVYGSAFFTGNIAAQSRKSSSTNTHCYVGVNDIGIHIISISTKQMVHSLEYREISWKHIQEKCMLEVKVIKPDSRESRKGGGSSTRGIIEIRTHQAGLIDHLMQQQLDRMHGDYANR